MSTKVTSTSTKAEILKAYDELLAELKEERKQNTALQQEVEKQKKVVASASSQVKGGATQNVRAIRQSLNQHLDEIETKLGEEEKKFEELQQAIALEKAMLEEVYKIKTEAESLDALIITNKQAREKLEKELADRKASLEKEIETAKTQWQREKEDYEYALRIKRRNEEDAYKEQKAKLEKELTEKKASFEKEFADREKALFEKEEELKRLRDENSRFETILNKSLQEKENEVTQRLSKEFEFQKQLETKDLQAELKLRDQMIESLKAKVQEQQELINALSSKTDAASQQVKDIAIKAIEKSGILHLGTAMERKKEEKGE